MRVVSPVTVVLQAALPVGLALSLAVALQALVLQQSFLPLQLPQIRLQTLSAAHLKSIIKYFVQHVPIGLVSRRCDFITRVIRIDS